MNFSPQVLLVLYNSLFMLIKYGIRFLNSGQYSFLNNILFKNYFLPGDYSLT
jgi:hypothetical protein